VEPTGDSQPVALSILDLNVGYGRGVTLDHLSLSVAQGEAVAVLGHNGVGKSTLFKTIMGLLKPTAGAIRLFDTEITGRQPFEIARAGIGYIPQGREIFPDLTVEQNLLLGRLSARNADEAYTFFPALRERRGARAGSLSGGQQQQLAIARALMGHPRLLLLDEPSEGVQPSVIAEITDILADIQVRERLTLILAEQNLPMVYRLCSRALIMGHGRIESEIETARLKAEPDLINDYLSL
jgi:ABC-type branched-subunit amino acid transport system ATPase component